MTQLSAKDPLGRYTERDILYVVSTIPITPHQVPVLTASTVFDLRSDNRKRLLPFETGAMLDTSATCSSETIAHSQPPPPPPHTPQSKPLGFVCKPRRHLVLAAPASMQPPPPLHRALARAPGFPALSSRPPPTAYTFPSLPPVPRATPGRRGTPPRLGSPFRLALPPLRGGCTPAHGVPYRTVPYRGGEIGGGGAGLTIS